QTLIDIFNTNRLSTTAAVINTQKLKWMNGEYIKTAELDTVIDIALPQLIEAGKVPKDMDEKQKEWTQSLIALYQEQLGYGAEIVELTDIFFKDDIDYD